MSVDKLIEKVFDFNGKSLKEWKRLKEEVNEWNKTASEEDKFKFKCSGAGEMLSIALCCYEE